MIPPFIYVSRCGLRRTAYCSGREETRCAEICQQRVELLDDVLYTTMLDQRKERILDFSLIKLEKERAKLVHKRSVRQDRDER